MLATVLARIGQPTVVQTDRGSCFVGTDGGQTRAVPSRFTMWLWGLGIEHRLIPPGKPQRNGVVERFQGAMEHTWRAEPDGLQDLIAVWNQGKPTTQERLTPYRGRRGFCLDRIWSQLERMRVVRRVDRDGKLSLWDRRVRVGSPLRNRTVTLTVNAARRVLVVSDERDVWQTEISLPFLTEDWLWEAVPPEACEAE